MIVFEIDNEKYSYDGKEIKPYGEPTVVSSFVSGFLNLYTNDSRGYLPLLAQLTDIISLALPYSKLTILSNSQVPTDDKIDGVVY